MLEQEKIFAENPDLPREFIEDILIAQQEARQGKLKPYHFSDQPSHFTENAKYGKL